MQLMETLLLSFLVRLRVRFDPISWPGSVERTPHTSSGPDGGCGGDVCVRVRAGGNTFLLWLQTVTHFYFISFTFFSMI